MTLLPANMLDPPTLTHSGLHSKPHAFQMRYEGTLNHLPKSHLSRPSSRLLVLIPALELLAHFLSANWGAYNLARSNIILAWELAPLNVHPMI